MYTHANSIENNALASLTQKASTQVIGAIEQASANTGVDFAYLVQQANAESSFDPNAKARTSSATGLYQFIESTWMNMIEKHGQTYGIDTSSKSRREILELRKDPTIAANMAAEFASENEQFLNENWGGEVGSTELYLAHFLGAGGATAFLNARDENPVRTAAYIFPEAARANRNVFYDSANGQARSLDQIYAFFDQKFRIESQEPVAPKHEPVPVHQDISSEMLLAFGVENSGFDNFADDALFQQHYATSSVFSSGFKELESIYGASTNRNVSPLAAYQALVHAPIEIMLLAEMDLPFSKNKSKSL